MVLKRLVVALMVSAFAAATAAQAPDPLSGTWKLNTAKSKTPFTSGTSVIESAGDGIKATVDLDGPDGKYHFTYSAKFDGKDNPVTGTNPFGNTVALTKVNAKTIKTIVKQDGKPTVTQTMTLSADGKTRTIITKGKTPKGQAVDSTGVYEKQ
jgi:hypothetical protein